MSEVTSRRRYILSAVQEMKDAHEEWIGIDGMEQLTQRLWDGIETVCDALSRGDIPGELRKVAAASAKLADAWERWKTQAMMLGDPAPKHAFWGLFMAVIKEAAASERPKAKRSIETLEELKGAPDANICRIYGWVDADGTPQKWKLAEERKNPGTHLNDSFVHPLDREEAEREAREAAKLDRLMKATEARTSTKTDSLEDLPKLVAQGLSAKQIGKMVKLAPADVQTVCAERGLPVPPMDYDPLASAKGVHDKPLNEATARALDAAAKNPVHAPASRKMAKAEQGTVKKGRGRPPKQKTLTNEQRETIRQHAEAGLVSEQIAQQMPGVSLPSIREEVEAWEQEVGAAEIGGE